MVVGLVVVSAFVEVVVVVEVVVLVVVVVVVVVGLLVVDAVVTISSFRFGQIPTEHFSVFRDSPSHDSSYFTLKKILRFPFYTFKLIKIF